MPSLPPDDASGKAAAPPPARNTLLLRGIGLAVLCFFGFTAFHLVRDGGMAGIILAVLFGFFALRASAALFFKGGVPVLASGLFERRAMIRILKQAAKESGARPFRVADLGSAGGALCRSIGRAIPEAEVTGVELCAGPHNWARQMQRLFGPKNVMFVRGDLLAHDCSGADAVVMFLSSGLTLRAGEKLARELKPGALVLANEFPLGGGWEPVEVIRLRTPFLAKLHVYRR